jgi:hypothetical protein
MLLSLEWHARCKVARSTLQFQTLRTVLSQAFGIDPTRQSMFDARLEHLRRIGVMTERPGKGVKVSYDVEQLDQLAFIIALSRFSIEPMTGLALLKARWDPPFKRSPSGALARGEASLSELFAEARKAQRPSQDICITIEIADFVSSQQLPSVGFFTGHRIALDGFYSWLRKGQNTASVFNLSTLLRRLDAALASLSEPVSPLGAEMTVARGRPGF